MSDRKLFFRPGFEPFITVARDEAYQSLHCFLLVPHLARPSRSPTLPGGASAVLASCLTEPDVLLFFLGFPCLFRRLSICFCWQPRKGLRAPLCCRRVPTECVPRQRVEPFSRDAVNVFGRFVRLRDRRPGLHRAKYVCTAVDHARTWYQGSRITRIPPLLAS